MRDIGLDKLLVGLIGVPGLIACVMAWLQPMYISERVLTTAVGATGLAWALIRGISLRSIPAKAAGEHEESEVENRP